MSTDRDTCAIAINLARNVGYAVFPARADKSPACPHGFKNASTDPCEIARLWHRFPGELIGIATGTVSRLWVLDVDQKHRSAWEWWQANHHRLLPTRTYATRSGGLHLHFRAGDVIGCSTGRISRGVDTRGDGGYVIHWFATGLACFDHHPPAPWPPWLRSAVVSPPRPAVGPRAHTAPAEAAVAGILRRVAEACEGERNAVLFWATCRLAERGLRRCDIEALLVPTAVNIGLSEPEVRRTITSALARAA
jgi:hypothetical protein